jgi:hypothetical protein
MSERRVNHHTRQKFECLRADLLRRLTTVCQQFQQSELTELTSRMLRVQIKYDAITAVPGKRESVSAVCDGRRSVPPFAT